MIYDYEYFKKAIFDLTKVDLNAYKEKQMKRRIDTLIGKHGIVGYDKYVHALKTDKAMFDEFVLPELAESCRKLDRTIYHLDGVGELNHLDSLLTIKELNAIQWVPGAGQPGRDKWPEVQKKIIDGGKNIQVAEFYVLDNVSKQVGTGGKHIHMYPDYVDISRKAEMIEKLKTYGNE